MKLYHGSTVAVERRPRPFTALKEPAAAISRNDAPSAKHIVRAAAVDDMDKADDMDSGT